MDVLGRVDGPVNTAGVVAEAIVRAIEAERRSVSSEDFQLVDQSWKRFGPLRFGVWSRRRNSSEAM